MTPEEIQKSIDAAFDSVSLINNLKGLPSLSQEDTEILTRNKNHLIIMLSKDWFVSELNQSQLSAITTATL
jgi:hypothetical protein